MTRAPWLTGLLAAALALSGSAHPDDDTDALKRLEGKGAKVTRAKGAVGVSVGECANWTDDDYKVLGRVPNVTTLSFGLGFAESKLPLLRGLSDLEGFSSNGMQFTDEGVKVFTQFPRLKRLTFFHPPRTFTGVGLSHLSGLKHLEDLSIGGSPLVGDEALAAIGAIKTLKRLRVWHDGNTNAGVKRLTELPALESLMLGQRLTNAPPSCPNDETIPLLLEMETLKSLVLAETRYGYPSLVRLKQLPELRQLTLSGVDMSEADFERLKKDMPDVRISLSKPTAAEMQRIDKLFGKQ
jgi:hypothetical protein